MERRQVQLGLYSPLNQSHHHKKQQQQVLQSFYQDEDNKLLERLQAIRAIGLSSHLELQRQAKRSLALFTQQSKSCTRLPFYRYVGQYLSGSYRMMDHFAFQCLPPTAALVSQS